MGTMVSFDSFWLGETFLFVISERKLVAHTNNTCPWMESHRRIDVNGYVSTCTGVDRGGAEVQSFYL